MASDERPEVVPLRQGDRARPWLALTAVLGVVFLALQAYLIDQTRGDAPPRGSAYGSIVATLSEVHWAHVAAGVLLAAWALLRLRRSEPHGALVSVTALYWHFLNAVAIVVAVTLILGARG